jgi:hypothetical protein
MGGVGLVGLVAIKVLAAAASTTPMLIAVGVLVFPILNVFPVPLL